MGLVSQRVIRSIKTAVINASHDQIYAGLRVKDPFFIFLLIDVGVDIDDSSIRTMIKGAMHETR